MRRLQAQSDEGAILVITLAFLAFFGLVALALLGQSNAGLKNSVAISGLAKKVYSADGAIDYAMEAIQTDSTLCPDKAAGSTPVGGSVVINADAQPVSISCQTIDNGSAGGWRGFGIVTTSSDADSLQTQSGPDKIVDGAVFIAGGVTGAKNVIVHGADFFQAQNPCSPQGSASPNPPFGTVCGATSPTLDAVVATAPATTDPPKDTTTQPGCTIFSPGVYTTAPVLGKNNYFKSGVYYFRDIGAWTIDKVSVAAGTPGADTTDLVTPCFAEGATANGSGAEFVLQGTSTMAVTNQAEVEIYSRQPPTPDGTSGISLFVQGSRPGAALTQLNGNPRVVIHGSVYSPDANVLTNATGGVSFWMLNGIVAKKLLLQSTSDGLKVATSAGNSSRRVVITATAPGASGERVVMATAVVDVAADPGHTLTVISRRTE